MSDVREKVARRREATVEYPPERWGLLRAKRRLALEAMESLEDLVPAVYGSVARGDVRRGSDVDVVIPRPVPSFEVESRLPVAWRELVGATPWLTPKACYHLGPEVAVTVPLWHPTAGEEGFHRFGGSLGLSALREGRRVPGVDKRLVLITPTPEGHSERAVLELGAAAVARELALPLAVVEERVAVLARRDAVGRTGVFLRRALAPDEGVEDVARRLAPRFQRRP